MSSPGQKRGACGHAMASFDGHLSCARCRDKGKGKDTCVEDKDSTNCSHCNVLTPEQKAQLATPSYKLKKEKREAKKLETETPKDSESLVDPSSVSVIGVVDNAGVVQSPSVPPEKKVKKDKVLTKPKKSTSSTEGKIADLDLKWSERFNCLEALLLSKSFPPSFSADVQVSPSHTPPANISKDSEPFFQPSVSSTASSKVERTGPDISDASQHQSAGKLQETQPIQRTGPDTQLQSNSRPVSYLASFPELIFHLSALARTLRILPRTSRPASFQHRLQDKLLASLSLIDPSPTDLQTDSSLHLHRTYTGHLDGTTFPVWILLPTVTYRTDHPLNCLLKRQTCQITRRVSRIRTFRKIRPTEKQCGGYAHTWDGPMYRTLTAQSPLMIIRLPAQRLRLRARFQSRCRQRIGYVEN